MSKITERVSKDMGIELIIVTMLYVIYKIIPTRYYENLLEKVKGEESYIILESHRKKYYTNGYPSKEIVKISYSERFKGLHHYLLHNCGECFPHVYEIMEILEKNHYSDIEEYILIPYENKKVNINKRRNISIEMSKKKIDGEVLNNEYMCKISTPEKNPKVLYEFLEECIESYNEYKRKRNNKQSIYEYIKSENDEDGNRVAKYKEVSFISNKHLTRNIYFPEKESFIKELDKFVNNKEKHKEEYEECGQTYKLSLVLHGEPGTGKTSIVRGMLNYTGRDAVVVPWCNIKTCGDLASILRNNMYNGKKKELKDMIFIFEDFDANRSTILKTRKHPIKCKRNDETEIKELVKNIEEKATEINTPKEIIEEIKKLHEYAATSIFPTAIEDELTLEYVLNMLDGIVENHDAIIVFTTNHLEEIDPALIRPGRIDYKLELKNATVNTIKEMVSKKYRLREPELYEYNEYFLKMKDYVLSPAEVQNEIFMRDNIVDCLENLLSKYTSKSS